MSVDLLTTFDCRELSSPAMTHRTCLINRDMAGKLTGDRMTHLERFRVCLTCKEYAKIKAQHKDWKPYQDARGNTRYPGPSWAEQQVVNEPVASFAEPKAILSPQPLPQKEPPMTEFKELITAAEKKAAILKTLDKIVKQALVSPTKKNIAAELQEGVGSLEYWFQMLKREGVIRMEGGGPGVSGTVSRVESGDYPVEVTKKPERVTADCPKCDRALSRYICNAVEAPKLPVSGCPKCGKAWVDCVCDEPVAETKEPSGRPPYILQPAPAPPGCQCGPAPEVNQVTAPQEPGIMTGDPPPDSPPPPGARARVKEEILPPLISVGLTWPCPNHPDQEQAVGKNGRRQGICRICQAARTIGNPDRSRVVQLYFPDKHLDLKAWLEQQGDAEERDLKEQIFFTLKKGREAICQSK